MKAEFVVKLLEIYLWSLSIWNFTKKWIFHKYFSKILIKFHDSNFSEHYLVDACLCLCIYSILLLRYWFSTIVFSKFVFYYQFLHGFFVEKTWHWIIWKACYLFLMLSTSVNFGEATGNFDRFFWGSSFTQKMKNNQNVKIRGVYFWEPGWIKRGRVSGKYHLNQTCHFYNLILSFSNLICYLKCISSFSWRCKADEWQIKWTNPKKKICYRKSPVPL